MTSLLARRRERARIHFGARTLLVFAAVVLLAVPFGFLVLLVHARHDWVQSMDHRVAAGLHSFGAHHGSFVTAMRVVSDVAEPVVWWLPVLVVAGLLAYRRRARRPAAFVVVAFGGSLLLNQLVKAAVDRARPHLPHAFATAHGASFPSGHAQAATVACGVLIVAGWRYLSRRARAIAVAAAVVVVSVVCLSRVALGVHYVSDVVAAVVLGAAWLLLMSAAFTAWQHEAIGWSPGRFWRRR
jgi:undecaprenyl-diphosphatase